MTVSFKQFSAFVTRTQGDVTQAQIDEAWADIFRRKKEEADKDEDKNKNKVLSAKDKLKKAAEDKKTKEEERKKELQKKRDEAWQRAKDQAEGRSKPSTQYSGRSERDDYALHRMREGKESYSEEGYWKDDANKAGYKVKKLSGDLMKGDQTWGAFDGDKKMGEFTEKEDGRGGWLITESLNEAKTVKAYSILNSCAKKMGETGFAAMDEDDMAKLLNMRSANAAAKKQHGEFGLATCTEKEIRDLVNAHPEWLKGEAKKKFTAA